MNTKKIEQGVRLILEGIGEDLQRDGLRRTPQRVAEMCAEIFGGITKTPQITAGFTEAVGPADTILIRHIPFHSVCEHHLLPFFGKIDILYCPQDNKVAGFSRFSNLVDGFARRPQIQERLTGQIADAIMAGLAPRGVMVVCEATQLCVSMRGDHKKDLTTVTETIRGELPDHQIQRLR